MNGTVESAAGRATLRKIERRIVPFLCLLYFVSFLDRVNIGFAALTMNDALGLSPSMFGIGAGIFFLGYVLFEVPSNVMLARVGARRWIARIMITWGLVSAAFAFVQGPISFYVLRFLLGVAEAGFFPGIVWYLTLWIPAAHRGRVLSLFLLALPISNVVGAPLSTSLLQIDALGLAGWQWMFLLEGLPAVLLGIVVWRWLLDGPDDARWLEPRERAWLARELAAEHAQLAHGGRHRPGAALRDPRVWMLGAVYFCVVVGLYALGFWLPQIVKSLSSLTNAQIGWLAVVPYATAALAMIAWGRHSDRTGERRWHVILPALVAAAGFAASALPGLPPAASLAALTAAGIGIYCAIAVFWTLPPMILSGTAAAAGIALVNSVGNVGGFVGPTLLGQAKQATGGYSLGFALLAGLLALGALLVAGSRTPR